MKSGRQTMGGVLTLLLTVALAQPISAQIDGEWSWIAAYSPVMGIGDTKDFIDGLSWRGATLDAKRWFGEDFTVGGSVGWHVLNGQGSGTSQFDGGAISGTALRFLNAVPVLATASYFFGEAGTTRPFLGVGTGTYWIENRTEAGIFLSEESNWHFGLMGEAGVAIKRPGRTVTLSVRYNQGLKTNEIEHSYLTFSIGFGH